MITERLQPEVHPLDVIRHHQPLAMSPRNGKMAYEAYCSHAGGKSLVTQAPLTAWVHLPQDIREAWHAAADAVWADCIALHNARGGRL